MKPSATDYLPFLEAARGHEANARASGSLVDAEIARILHLEAVNLRQAALYPPERCIDCGATIHGDQRWCHAMVTQRGKLVQCGRARQGVKMGQREVINLLRFFETYPIHDDTETQRHTASVTRWRKKKRERRLAKLRDGGCICNRNGGKRKASCPFPGHGKTVAPEGIDR